MDLAFQLLSLAGKETSPERVTFLLALVVLVLMAAALKRERNLNFRLERELEAYHDLHTKVLEYLIVKGDRHDQVDQEVVDQPPAGNDPKERPAPHDRRPYLGPRLTRCGGIVGLIQPPGPAGGSRGASSS